MKKILISILSLFSTVSYAGVLNKVYLTVSPKSAGIGYNITKKYRVDVTAGISKAKFKDQYVEVNDTVDDSSVSGTKRIRKKSIIKAVMFNNYYDLIQNDYYTIFAKFGIGRVRIKEKKTDLFSGVSINGLIIPVPLSVEQSSSKHSKTAYSLGLGAGIKLNQKVNVDLGYSYDNLNKTKYKFHSCNIGLRLNI